MSTIVFPKVGAVEKVAPLGRGAMGAVWKVKVVEEGKKHPPGALFALKTVDLNGLKAEEQQAALNEVRVLKRLVHPQVLRFVEAAIGPQELSILTELVDGGDLAKFLQAQSGRLDELVLCSIFVQVCQGLGFLHAQRCIHRDVKPSNIFLTRSGGVKLGDFGVSKLLTDSTVSHRRTCVGSPYYMAPELCQGEAYDEKADIWSLGCLLFELCATSRPFEAPNLGALVMRITQAEPAALPDGVSEQLRAIIDKLLCKTPEKRPTVADVLKNPFLQAFLFSETRCLQVVASALPCVDEQEPDAKTATNATAALTNASGLSDDSWSGAAVITGTNGSAIAAAVAAAPQRGAESPEATKSVGSALRTPSALRDSLEISKWPKSLGNTLELSDSDDEAGRAVSDATTATPGARRAPPEARRDGLRKATNTTQLDVGLLQMGIFDAQSSPSRAGSHRGAPDNGPEATVFGLELTRQPLEATRQPLEATRQPLEATRQPLELTRQPLDATRPPLELTQPPHEATGPDSPDVTRPPEVLRPLSRERQPPSPTEPWRPGQTSASDSPERRGRESPERRQLERRPTLEPLDATQGPDGVDLRETHLAERGFALAFDAVEPTWQVHEAAESPQTREQRARRKREELKELRAKSDRDPIGLASGPGVRVDGVLHPGQDAGADDEQGVALLECAGMIPFSEKRGKMPTLSSRRSPSERAGQKAQVLSDAREGLGDVRGPQADRLRAQSLVSLDKARRQPKRDTSAPQGPRGGHASQAYPRQRPVRTPPQAYPTLVQQTPGLRGGHAVADAGYGTRSGYATHSSFRRGGGGAMHPVEVPMVVAPKKPKPKAQVQIRLPGLLPGEEVCSDEERDPLKGHLPGRLDRDRGLAAGLAQRIARSGSAAHAARQLGQQLGAHIRPRW